jgi:hypothetical protein
MQPRHSLGHIGRSVPELEAATRLFEQLLGARGSAGRLKTYLRLRAICDGIRKKLIATMSTTTDTNRKNWLTGGSGFMPR